jgi:hypothetical protein
MFKKWRLPLTAVVVVAVILAASHLGAPYRHSAILS